ncbi:MAG: 3-hydroxyacyl-CoA dehydrogenase NAD-binding domain-containing protein [Thermoleophilia bacterium]
MPSTAIVIGTGAMGPEIAAALGAAGVHITIAGRSASRAADAAARAAALRGDGSPPPAAAAIADAPFAAAELVVETITEDLEAKRALMRDVTPRCAPDAVIATNTSSLRVGDIAEAVVGPERFGGLHFLKPAHLTGVVEVIPGPRTSAATTARLREFGTAMGKTPLLVRADVPGFIWNRVQFAVLRECLHMVQEGVASAEDVDAAVADGLAARWVAAGPLATADLGGLRTFATICGQLFPHLASGTEAPPLLTEHAESGTPLAPWTRGERADAVAALRADALRSAREFTRRRRELGA